MLIRAATALVLALLLAGCRSRGEETTITRDQFIDVIVQLRMADMDTDDPAVFAARRDSILREAGVTDSMLLAYARVHGGDVAHMAEVWDTISRRLIRADTIPR